MASHNETGKQGEELAARWLKEHGYELLHRNWRHSHYEIDIVATKGKFLHFVEIKTLNAPTDCFPEASVTKKKFKHLQKAVDEYLFLNPGHKWIQYDVLSIIIHSGRECEYFLLEDVFL
jgi:putative endonuclease